MPALTALAKLASSKTKIERTAKGGPEMLSYDYPEPVTLHRTVTLAEKPPRPVKGLAKALALTGRWVWDGLCEFGCATIYYDERGQAHSALWWF
jgi:hypothetical protein